tara:strand:- start:1711 stop:2151 length:441 start_codon:yes stop_codon:yes gene_type:complete
MLENDKLFKVSVTVAGPPVGKARPRFTRTGHVYTPAKSKDYEKLVSQSAWVAMVQAKIKPTEKPVYLEIEAYMPIPKSWSKAKQDQARMGVIRPAKPDLDNIIKAILDGCNSVIYRDDVQVHSIKARKLYENYEHLPSVELTASWE